MVRCFKISCPGVRGGKAGIVINSGSHLVEIVPQSMEKRTRGHRFD